MFVVSPGVRIKQIRKEKGISQKELAKRLNIAPNTLYRYECGNRAISLEMIEKIATAFEMPVEQLLSNVNLFSYDTEASKNFERLQQRMIEQQPKNKLLSAFDKLNEKGQEKAIERVEELTEIQKYTDKSK